jgi:enamine deaminase RidA (YjgF/YER057c/UK114 family)
MPPLEIVTPSELAPPRGYSHGVKGRGELLFVAGQIGWDAQQRLVSDDFAAQFGQALDNVLAVVRAAGGAPASIARLTLYVTDRTEYRARARDIGAIYRARMGRHYPAMALVEVRSLLEDAAKVEIEATAVL